MTRSISSIRSYSGYPPGLIVRLLVSMLPMLFAPKRNNPV